MDKTIILSLGGSIIVPDNIDTTFLKNFKVLIEKYLDKGYKFVIFCGGGKIARRYQDAGSKITELNNNDLDWLGIEATKLNAQLLKSIFKDNVEDIVIKNPNDKINFKKKIVIGAGWKPGWSTDFDAVLVGKNLGVDVVVNMSNIDYVYDKDPSKDKNAKKFENLSWKNYRKLISSEWSAGLNSPFDPVASKEAQKLDMDVVIIGKDLKNFENYLEGESFKGTVIE
tara:strand:+ start:166 stop:843 length:678 start_codon:yes stop_codon:yes gene_type:complete